MCKKERGIFFVEFMNIFKGVIGCFTGGFGTSKETMNLHLKLDDQYD